MSPNSPIKEDLIHDQILQAALQLFQQYGVAKVTMDDVAKAIGKGRSSLYYYYKSKEEILDAVMDVEIGEIVSEVGQAVDRVSATKEKIYVFFTTKLAILDRKKVLFHALKIGMDMDAEALSIHVKAKQGVHERYMKREGALLRQILTQGIAQGELRAMSDVDLDLVIFVLLSSIRGLKREIAMENDYSRQESGIRTLTDMTINGLKK